MKYALVILLTFFSLSVFAAEDVNSRLQQEGNRGVLRYDLKGEPNEDAEVNLSVEIEGKKYTQEQLSVSGDVGKVVTGSNKVIYWDVLKDFPRGLVGNVNWFLDVGEYKDPVTGMEFVFVKGGCFQMGSNSGDSDEKPVHEVCVDDFYIGKYEVTNAQYRRYQSGHSSKDYEGNSLNGDSQPVVYVSWDDAKSYANWLSRQGGKTFRLPTEAEWEYAARAGTRTERFWGDSSDSACGYANVADQYAIQRKGWSKDSNDFKCSDGYAASSPVGKFKPNALGLYDMLGNVWEWVEDIYSSDAYSKHQRNNPIYTGSGSYRVLRGGSWLNSPQGVRSADRGYDSPGNLDSFLGFRLAMTVN